jgi:hypothetical protein
MSKLKPEIGDVWISNRGDETKIFITNSVGRISCISQYGVIDYKFVSDFGTNYKYLGKSKVKAKDMFDVAED